MSEVIIHCSATRPDQHVTAADIKQWHLAKGWSDIGYHWVIERDGTVVKGRTGTGAHTVGHNDKVGVCMVGGVSTTGKPQCNFTIAQWGSLHVLLQDLEATKTYGHNQFAAKACPSFAAEYLL